jgi:predicted phage terminase large subunit-like protein
MPSTREGKLELLELLYARERLRSVDYWGFFTRAWKHLQPATPLIENWHMKYLCEIVQKEAERIARGESKTIDYIINVPPRSLKSSIFAMFLVAWVWSRFPAQKFLTASYSGDLALEHAVQSRRLIQTPWYQDMFGDRFSLTGDQNVKSYFENDHSGYRISTSVGGSGTGRGGDWTIIDDPLSADEAESEVLRKRAVDWFRQTIYSRLNDQRTGVRIIVMQRLHEEDLTGYLLANHAKDWELICLPAEISDNVTPKSLRSRYVSGVLFPARLGKVLLDDMRGAMGAYEFAGQYQQRPSPQEGGIFKRHHWKFWQPKGARLPSVPVTVGDQFYTCPVVDLPDDFEDEVISWDCAFKDKKSSDYVAGGVVGMLDEEMFLIDLDMSKKDFVATSAAVLRMSQKYPEASASLVEDAANGPAVVNDLAKVVPGLVAVSVVGESKYSRAQPLSRRQQAGQVYLPHPSLAPWVGVIIDQFAAFPNAAYDDAVDMFSQANKHLSLSRRVWSTFGSRRIVKTFKVNFRELSPASTLVVSQWVGRDLSSSVLLALWSSDQRKLWVFDELRLPDSRPQVVISGVSSRIRLASEGFIGNHAPFQWYGSPTMFATGGVHSRPGADISEAYRRESINVQENLSYDESGAITLVSRIIAVDALRIHSRCLAASKEIASWPIDRGQPVPEYYYARCLCNMVSMLSETGRMDKKALVMKSYSRGKEEMMRRMDEADKAGRLAEWVQGGEEAAWSDAQNDPNAWMAT